jgi:hypothetical protein
MTMSLFAPHTIVGTPVSLAYGHETNTAVLRVRTAAGDYEFRATGGLAFSLLRQVTKDVKGIVVEYNPTDPTEIVSFTVQK